MCCFKLFGALSFLVIKKRGVKYRQYRLTYMFTVSVPKAKHEDQMPP